MEQIRRARERMGYREANYLLVSECTLIKAVGLVNIVWLRVGNRCVSRLHPLAVAKSLVSVLLCLSHVTTPLPLHSLSLESLSLLVARKSAVSICWVCCGSRVGEVQTLQVELELLSHLEKNI